MLCKCHWIVSYTEHFTAFCLEGGAFFPGHGVDLIKTQHLVLYFRVVSKAAIFLELSTTEVAEKSLKSQKIHQIFIFYIFYIFIFIFYISGIVSKQPHLLHISQIYRQKANHALFTIS